jgi:predicted O-linked N-acetylglucosamine transferase (SPINDLY family)
MQLFERICRENKKDFEAWVYLGITKSALGDSIAAEACLRHAIRLQPTNALAHFNLGCALEANKKYGAAVQAFQQAIRLKPDYFEAWHNLASVLRILGQTSAATGAFKRALALNPHSAETYRGLASTYVTQGKATEAAAVCKQVLALTPEHVSAHSLLLFLSTLYLEDPREIYRIHLQWARQHPVSKLVGWWENTELDANERIRVGYLSPNFYQHSVAYFFEPLIANHDRSRFEIFCYSDVENEDSVTERIREHATVWRDSLNLPDNALAKQIMHDRIHILVDLAGHTTRNRLMVMMQKPAPIQMQYIGYLFSTGIDRIDYWMTDRWTDPQGLSDEVSAETIIRLPRGYLSYQPYQQAPAVSPPPWKRNGYVTFGSFNHVSKISDAAYELWLEVLRNNPDTHLILKNESFLDQPTRKEWLDRFHTSGIHKDRIQLRGITESVVEHLELYSQVDIGLDTMPYNGTTTTCEALWQGVPVITLPGKTHCSRQGLSLLNQVGLSDFIAESQSHFVAIASGFVNRPERISELRSDLRDRMKSSSLCDGTGLTKDVEAAYAAVMAQWRNTVEHRT